MLKWSVSIVFLWISLNGLGQDLSNTQLCGQQCFSDSIRQQNPNIENILRQNEIEANNWIFAQKKNPTTQSIITIPVVFHVLYNTEEQNLSDEQLLNQLDVLNRDYRKNNPDTIITPTRFKSISADTKIEFCLAIQTPDGQLTNGIIRKEVNQTNIGTTKNYYQPAKGGTQIWDPRYYLNVWVCEINDTLLGYTYLPGEPQANFDGIVLSYKVCGDGLPAKPPYNKGRTLVHEVGHWLNLQHPWGAQIGCQYDDGVSDTPAQEQPNGGCPNQIKISCGNSPDGDMYVNYMDYTYDNCKTVFTAGQGERMQATLNTSRSLLQNSIGCTMPDTTTPFVENVDFFPNPVVDFLTIRFNLSSTQNTQILIYDVTGKIIYNTEQQLEVERFTIDVTNFPNGSYIINASSNSINENFKFVKVE